LSKDRALILWVDKNTFATTLLEDIFKKRNISFYTINSVENFSYLVEDLKPSLMVLDSQTALENLEKLKLQYDSSEALRNLPVLVIDDQGHLDFIHNKRGTLGRPFDPFKIPDILLQT
jgi:DNA-binding NtrC family response regulator